MSYSAFPRDNGDDDAPRERERGRAVPRIVEHEPSPMLIDIRVNGVVFGTVDPEQLKARAMMDLERCQGTYDLLRWCKTHAGVSDKRGPNDEPSELDRLAEELAEMPLRAIRELAQSIGGALKDAVDVPKRSSRR